jgi:hypothetical protein
MERIFILSTALSCLLFDERGLKIDIKEIVYHDSAH